MATSEHDFDPTAIQGEGMQVGAPGGVNRADRRFAGVGFGTLKLQLEGRRGTDEQGDVDVQRERSLPRHGHRAGERLLRGESVDLLVGEHVLVQAWWHADRPDHYGAGEFDRYREPDSQGFHPEQQQQYRRRPMDPGWSESADRG